MKSNCCNSTRSTRHWVSTGQWWVCDYQRLIIATRTRAWCFCNTVPPYSWRVWEKRRVCEGECEDPCVQEWLKDPRGSSGDPPLEPDARVLIAGVKTCPLPCLGFVWYAVYTLLLSWSKFRAIYLFDIIQWSHWTNHWTASRPDNAYFENHVLFI